MPWTCNVCALKNVDDSAAECDLCGAKKGAPDPGAQQKRMSIAGALKMSQDEFDRNMQEKKRLEALKNVKGVFGVPLKTGAPRLVCDCIAYINAHGLDVEGIFRIPGEQDTVDALRAAYEKDEERNVLGEMKVEPHDVGTLFKLFFRMMPEPLIPTSHYDQILDAVRTEHKTKEELLEAVNKVANNIPSPNRECFGLVLSFLKRVASHHETNKMTPANLATCFAPSLLRAPEGASAQQALMDMSGAIGALNVLIRDLEAGLPQPTAEAIKQNTRYKAPLPALPPLPARKDPTRQSSPRSESEALLPGNSVGKSAAPVAPPPGMNAAMAGPPPPGMGTVMENKRSSVGKPPGM